MPKESPFEELDLTKYCRDRTKLSTIIQVYVDYQWRNWLTLGECEVVSHNGKTLWTVRSHFLCHTDGEHDSASIVRFEAIGLTFEMLLYGRAYIEGYIRPDDCGSFRVPTSDWDPYDGSTDCKRCKGKDAHKFVNYLPPENPELYEFIRGARFRLTTGIKRKGDE